MTRTHFTIIFQKLKWTNTQVHKYQTTIFFIHMLNNVYKKVNKFLKLDWSADK